MCGQSVSAFAAAGAIRPLRTVRRPRACRPRVRLCAGPGYEPAFFARIRAAAPAVLRARRLQIEGMEWSHARLCVYVAPAAAEDGDDAQPAGASVDDCRFASDALGQLIDEQDLVPADAYTLEVSTPGISDSLTLQHEFDAFKGFGVTVRTSEDFKKRREFRGTLHDRTESAIRINVKGRIAAIPREIVIEVRLDKAKGEP